MPWVAKGNKRYKKRPDGSLELAATYDNPADAHAITNKLNKKYGYSVSQKKKHGCRA